MRVFFLSLFFLSNLFLGAAAFSQPVEASGLVPCGLSSGTAAEMAPCTACHLLLMASIIIQWIQRVMVVIGIAVIMAMGVLYIVSAGNEKMISMAKGGIKAALIGITVIIIAWLIVNTIIRMAGASGFFGEYFQTGTFSFTCDTTSNAGTATSTGFGAGAGNGGAPGSGGNPGNVTCTTGKCASMSNVVAAAKNNASGVNSNIIMSIIDGGEGCNKSVSADGFGSCGYSQALPAVRAKCGITGSSSESCSKIQSDVQLDINCAAWLINSNEGRCGMDIRNVASCYNSGKPNNCSNTTNNYCGRVEAYYNSC